ncbi:MAG: TolB family protein [Dehalococcoidia bacterium]
MRLRTHTSTRSESHALVGLVAVSALVLAVLVLILALGDQRRLDVTLASPAERDSVPSTVSEIAISFNREPNHGAVEAAFSLVPQAEGTLRWRGRTLLFVPGRALDTGPYVVRITAGTLGRADEPMEDDFELHFTVREPGVAAIVSDGAVERLVELRSDGRQRDLASAPRISSFAVAPGGAEVAVVSSDKEGWGTLSLVDLATGNSAPVVQSAQISIGGVAWSPDGGTLVVIRRDKLPSGIEGTPRAWLLRRNGEFVAPIDPDGNPSLYPSWSPDGQQLGYVSPSDAKMVVRNLTTEETHVVGQPRGGAMSWSPDSTMVAFEAVPETSAVSSSQPQPVRVVSLDGTYDRSFGTTEDVRLAPKFWDKTTIVSLKRGIGSQGGGTELVFESLTDASVLRSIHLTGGADLILDWDLDRSRRTLLYAVLTAGHVSTFELDLESGSRTKLPIDGNSPRWIP